MHLRLAGNGSLKKVHKLKKWPKKVHQIKKNGLKKFTNHQKVRKIKKWSKKFIKL